MSAGLTYGPKASHENGPASIAVENRAGIVKAPQLTTLRTLATSTGQTIPSKSAGSLLQQSAGGVA